MDNLLIMIPLWSIFFCVCSLDYRLFKFLNQFMKEFKEFKESQLWFEAQHLQHEQHTVGNEKNG